ncbi:hypothetical protein BDP67DRAFT_493286 [Colletotrichum lupini]|nr:hypothetical protein BDP67DRAFT_493286 [Colletotrichum lupini]
MASRVKQSSLGHGYLAATSVIPHRPSDDGLRCDNSVGFYRLSVADQARLATRTAASISSPFSLLCHCPVPAVPAVSSYLYILLPRDTSGKNWQTPSRRKPTTSAPRQKTTHYLGLNTTVNTPTHIYIWLSHLTLSNKASSTTYITIFERPNTKHTHHSVERITSDAHTYSIRSILRQASTVDQYNHQKYPLTDTMKVTTILAAFLPVLALAQTSSGDTTTVTSTATQTKTITLERAHTTTMTYGTGNSTATFKPTGSVVASATAAATAATTSKSSAGAALNAGNLAFAGVAGMVAAIML